MSLHERIAAATIAAPCLTCRAPGPHYRIGVFFPYGRSKALCYRLCASCEEHWLDDGEHFEELQALVEQGADLYFARLQ
jgi:hypothetical protein